MEKEQPAVVKINKHNGGDDNADRLSLQTLKGFAQTFKNEAKI